MICACHVVRRLPGATLVAMLFVLAIQSQVSADELEIDARPPIAPDIRDDQLDVKFQRGDFVAVPIPTSNPTLGTGLVVGAAYFYPQTAQQKAIQPASLTAVGGMYTDNGSKALAVIQQNYWSHNKWRFTGKFGAADLRLSLPSPDETIARSAIDWRIKGYFAQARLSRQVWPNWYAGFLGRVIDARQTLEGDIELDRRGLLALPGVVSTGLGAYVEYDTRDMPTNAYSGHYFKAEALFNDEAIGSSRTYQNYQLTFNSYYRAADRLVLAWQVQGCSRGGKLPIWDACTLKLRGFSATDYMGTASISGQIEARWRVGGRWGLVGFGGGGYSRFAYGRIDNTTWVPSYGAGIRFMVLKAKRINMRLDYARSRDSDAIHLSFGEAF